MLKITISDMFIKVNGLDLEKLQNHTRKLMITEYRSDYKIYGEHSDLYKVILSLAKIYDIEII